jgi:hypothetical protein
MVFKSFNTASCIFTLMNVTGPSGSTGGATGSTGGQTGDITGPNGGPTNPRSFITGTETLVLGAVWNTKAPSNVVLHLNAGPWNCTYRSMGPLTEDVDFSVI